MSDRSPHVKVCSVCNRVYAATDRVCTSDGNRLVSVDRGGTTAAAPVIDWEGPLPGDIIGSYRIGPLIAEGGMGRIYAAHHLSVGREVAIKFLLPEHSARADLVQRFFCEARAVNAVEHPNIVQIYDFARDHTDDRLLVYIVMEYLKGEDLRIRLNRLKSLDPVDVVMIAHQVSSALAAAHSAEILHRDLKPDNIFICAPRADQSFEAVSPRGLGARVPLVKLLDFGAAKLFGSRTQALTRPGVAIGTPEYMSPEQIHGRPLSSAVDVYALGVVCYELLCGELPFKSADIGKLLAMHTEQPPRTLGPRCPADRRPSPELERLIGCCLEKNPAHRPTIVELMRALSACPELSVTLSPQDGPTKTNEQRAVAGPSVDTIQLEATAHTMESQSGHPAREPPSAAWAADEEWRALVPVARPAASRRGFWIALVLATGVALTCAVFWLLQR